MILFVTAPSISECNSILFFNSNFTNSDKDCRENHSCIYNTKHNIKIRFLMYLLICILSAKEKHIYLSFWMQILSIGHNLQIRRLKKTVCNGWVLIGKTFREFQTKHAYACMWNSFCLHRCTNQQLFNYLLFSPPKRKNLLLHFSYMRNSFLFVCISCRSNNNAHTHTPIRSTISMPRESLQ